MDGNNGGGSGIAMPHLAEHYRVIAVDQRGCGWIDAPKSGYGPRTLVADIVQLNRP